MWFYSDNGRTHGTTGDRATPDDCISDHDKDHNHNDSGVYDNH